MYGLLGGGTGVGETELTDGAHGSGKRRAGDDPKVLVVRCGCGRCTGRSVRDGDGDGDEEEGDDETERSGPGDPGDLVQGLDRGQEEDEDGGDGDKDGGAGAVQGHGVESDRDGQEGGSGDGGHP